VKLARYDAGRGECVVLIHGHPFDRTLWGPQLTALREEFRVVAPDLRGFGESPVTPGSVTMREYAADVEDLLDELGINRAAVIGLSMGVLVDYMQAGLYGPGCPSAVRARVDAMMAATSPAGAAAALRGRAERPDYRPVLAALDVPALVCAGTADPWSNSAVTAEILACLRHPELVVIDGAGHLPNLETERQFNEALHGFLQAHAPGGPPSAG
jgi:3-oxoadipate enol-lactonase